MRDVNTLLQNEPILEKISRIHLLKLITLIVRNLKKEDCREFEAILAKKDSGALLSFALAKIPQFEAKLLENIKATNQKLQAVASGYVRT